MERDSNKETLEAISCTGPHRPRKKPMARDPLHGITLEMILAGLLGYYGWEQLGRIIDIRCFTNNPTIKSSLTFLRRTPWARKKVEDLYLRLIRDTGKAQADPPA